MIDLDNKPYIVPVIFGYQDNCLYFHSANQGKKIDILKEHKQVCVEMDIDYEIKKHKSPCAWGMKYKSIIGFGKASFIDDIEGKKEAFALIMNHYSKGEVFEFKERALNRINVIRLELESLTGKKSDSWIFENNTSLYKNDHYKHIYIIIVSLRELSNKKVFFKKCQNQEVQQL